MKVETGDEARTTKRYKSKEEEPVLGTLLRIN